MKAVITEHHYADIVTAQSIFVDAGVHLTVGQSKTIDEAIELARDADVVICQHLPVTADMLDAWPHCRGVVHFGKGVDNIDVAAATRRGIWVVNVRDANWDEVSNHVLALLLAWARGLFAGDRHVRRGGWSYRTIGERHRLAGQVLGIIGYGDIGRLLAAKARGLGLEVVAYSRRPIDDPAVTAASLQELLRQSDFVSIHIPLTAETEKLIGRDELALMKPTAFLINTARGGVVDQRALLEALRSGRLAGAGLDVLEPEPPAPDDPVLSLENVIFSPHLAWYSEESREHVTVEAAREAVRILRGESPKSPVNSLLRPRFLSRSDNEPVAPVVDRGP